MDYSVICYMMIKLIFGLFTYITDNVIIKYVVHVGASSSMRSAYLVPVVFCTRSEVDNAQSSEV